VPYRSTVFESWSYNCDKDEINRGCAWLSLYKSYDIVKPSLLPGENNYGTKICAAKRKPKQDRI